MQLIVRKHGETRHGCPLWSSKSRPEAASAAATDGTSASEDTEEPLDDDSQSDDDNHGRGTREADTEVDGDDLLLRERDMCIMAMYRIEDVCHGAASDVATSVMDVVGSVTAVLPASVADGLSTRDLSEVSDGEVDVCAVCSQFRLRP